MKNILQKVSALALALVATIGAYAQYPALTFSDVNIAPGEEKTVTIYLADSPEDETVNLQVDVYLPEGFELVPNSQAKGDRCLSSHKAQMSAVQTTDDGREWARLGVTNASAKALKADNSLSVMTFKIIAPEADEMPLIATIDGENIITAGNVNSYKGTKSAPYTATGTITNSEVPHPTMTFEGLDTLNMKEGDTRTINLDATWGAEYDITGAQGEIILPQGLSFVPNEEGDVVSFNESRLVDHSSVQNLKDNGHRAIWMLASDTRKVIDPGSAEAPQFGSFTIKADKAFVGDSVIRSTYLFVNTDAQVAANAADSLVVTVAGGAGPEVAFDPDSVGLVENTADTLNLKVTVPEGASYKSAKAVVTLPASLAFAEGVDGTFSLDEFAADTVIAVPVKALKATEKADTVVAILTAQNADGVDLIPDTTAAVVTIAAPAAPAFEFAPDTLALTEGATGNVTLKVTVPEGTKPTVAGKVVLPEGLSFVAGDGSFNFAADKDSTLTFAVKAGKAFEGTKEITASATATSELGTEYPAFADTINVTVAQLAAPAFELAPKALALTEGATGNVTLKVTVPEGTKPAVAGKVVLPEGITFVEGDGTFNIAAAKDSTLTFAVKAGKAFEGTKEITASAAATSEAGTAYPEFADTITVTVAKLAAPAFAIDTDTLELGEGAEGEFTLAVTVPEGTKPTIAGTVTLPEGLTFVEGDGKFNFVANADSTLTFAVKAGKAYEGYKNIAVAATATSEEGTAYDPFNATVAVAVAAPEAPSIEFANNEDLSLYEGGEASIQVNLVIPEGTELSGITGSVVLPTGVSFSTTTAGVNVEKGSANLNGNTASWTSTLTENGLLLTLNIVGSANFQNGDITVVATATSKEGTEFEPVTITRHIVNATAAGINGINADNDVVKNYNGPIYNLAGQRVSKSYKGVVIINGKKYVNK